MRTTRRRTRLLPGLLAAALTAVVLAGCGTDEGPDVADDEPTSAGSGASSPTSEPPATESASPATSSATPAAETVAVPVYFVGDTPLGPRLFREFRDVGADDPVDEALALLTAGDALDPDYRTLLPAGSITLAGHDESIALTADPAYAERPDGMSPAEAKLAVQQVVRTVQGALQKSVPVAFDTDMLGLGTSFKAAGDNAVLALVNITEPAEGATVSGTFTASGVANSFEATVPWQIRDGSGQKVQEGFATAEGWGDKLYPWQAPVDVSALAPGTYTFVASTDDAADGEGAGPTEDTKTITVQ
ncbi:hypothetical protein G5V58_07980 [Nocardioides anomalus]|uniref:Bacterial spore germination immunoglobulin-like domain-containing protein n=1 Tax=Nocardioides anomalus TaxID=2712223 RepID=A0A6G6WBY8_9ACTN|nr:Gmad2 immunoglobulin-like domain-containing protein [Nocardioides anomalus]QIG42729.1 hypothetical protein G5V58_07980 [Nocardioides anomalus]